jgi:hypothetical protein
VDIIFATMVTVTAVTKLNSVTIYKAFPGSQAYRQKEKPFSLLFRNKEMAF